MSLTTNERVPQDELISLDHLHNLPYLKHIELTKYSPRHFGLEKWTRLFVIPDQWMRRIYRREVWRDTELPEPSPEQITKEQKRILYEWLFNHSPIKDEPPIRVETRGSRTRPLLFDDIIDLLNIPSDCASEEDCDTEKVSSSSQGSEAGGIEQKIPICYGHKIQPEYVIFEKAICKMKSLSAEEEAEFSKLVNDKEFMKFLSDNIGDHLGANKACCVDTI
jgi:hypothetical protein